MSSNDLVLVTGASGFIAKHVIKQALAAGYRVRGTLRDMTSYRSARLMSARSALRSRESNLNFAQKPTRQNALNS
jgi:nucleoside-diphosphate-sugar epimerase